LRFLEPFPRICTILLVSSFLTALASAEEYRFLENGNSINRGSDSGFLLDTPSRLKIDLSGTWNYSVDGGPGGTVKVPCAYDFIGQVAFERKFEVNAEQLNQYEFNLVMLGTNYSCEVYINGDFVLSHVGGYTSFVQPILGNTLQVGTENVIRVIVSNELDPKRTIPPRSNVWAWRNYGGILRDVFLLATPRLSISRMDVSSSVTESASSARVIVRASVDGILPLPVETPSAKKPAGFGFYAELFDKVSGISVGKSPIVSLVKKGIGWETAQTEIVMQNPKLWSPESPELYLIKSYVVPTGGKEQPFIDEYDIVYGIRQLEIRDHSIVLNGKRVVLKGVLWYEDHPMWGSSLTYEEMEKDVVLMKNLGGNAVRFANHPPHPYMLDLCDRYGLLALEELPITNIPSTLFAEEAYIDLAKVMMKEMVTRDKNHPSVLAWGIGDEFESSGTASRSFVDSLVKIAKGLDSRPVYFGSRGVTRDGCSDLVDIAAVSQFSHDIKTFRRELEEWKEHHPGKPVIVSKFGTEVQQGNRNGYSDPLSFEAQARFYIQRFDALRLLDYDGAFVWSFNDWKGDRPALTVTTGNPWMHTMGLVSYEREKRLAYDAVRSAFHGEKFVALPIGNYSASAPMIYVLSGLVVLIGGAYFYNANRRFRENINRSVMNSYNFFSDVRDQRIVSVALSTLLGVVVSVATAIVASSILYHFRSSWVLDNMLSYVLPSDSVKEQVVYLIWSPIKFIPVASLVIFISLLLVCGFVLLLSPVFKARIYPFHAYAITMWSTPPLLLFVPAGMILHRVMESNMYVIPSLIFVAVLFLWVLFRLLKGISIIFDVIVVKMYVLGVISIVGVLVLAYFYFDYTQSASMYWIYMYTMMSNSQ
jgi:hypothetical protein